MLILLLLILLLNSIQADVSDYDVDEYYGYEESAVEASVPEPVPRGFERRIGGGLVRIKARLASDSYINDTSVRHKCVPRIEALLAYAEKLNMTLEYNITTEIMSVSEALKKMSMLSQKVTEGFAANNLTSVLNSLAEGTEQQEEEKDKPQKRLTFREIQEAKMQQRREQKAEREAYKPKYSLGADCEGLICGG